MKHTVKMLLCLVLSLGLVTCFAACKKNQAPQAGTALVTSDEGTIYYLSGLTYTDADTEYTYNAQDLVNMVADPTSYYIVFYNDGTGILRADWEELYFEYDGTSIWDPLASDEPMNYTLQGDALTLEQNNEKLIFTRGELPDELRLQTEPSVDPDAESSVDDGSGAD